MKRSEMVDLICRAIQYEIGGHYSSFYEHAEAALKACEKEGMLPPFYKEFDRSLGEAKSLVKNYKWEQEDPDDDNYDKIRSGCK